MKIAPLVSTLVLATVTALALPSRTAGAAVVTLDFEEIAIPADAPNGINLPSTYEAMGMRLVATHDSTPGALFLALGSIWAHSPGSTILGNNFANGRVTLSAMGGSAFDFVGIDLYESPNFLPDGSRYPLGIGAIILSGLQADGSSVSTTIAIPEFPSPLLARPTGFTNLLSLSWINDMTCYPNCYPSSYFDNVQVSVHDIPEPLSLQLVAIALVPILATSLRRRGKRSG